MDKDSVLRLDFGFLFCFTFKQAEMNHRTRKKVPSRVLLKKLNK